MSDDRNTRADKRSVIIQSLEEERSIDDLTVKGRIPDWIDGSLFRNTPAKFEVGDRQLNHLFDGYAMLHLFTLRNGDVSYQNKFLESDAYKHAREGEMKYKEFGTDPCRDIFEQFFTYFKPPDPTDNAVVNVAEIADEYLALTETPIPVEFDPETLDTLEIKDGLGVDGHLTTAHPHFDSERGATISYITEFSFRHRYKYFQIDNETGERDVINSIPTDEPAYMHSFGMTENYVVLAEFPLVLDPFDVAIGNDPIIKAFEWKPEKGTRFTILDKDSGEVIARPSTEEAFFSFHHVNAFEQNGRVNIDLVTYPDADIIHDFYLEDIRSEGYNPSSPELSRVSVDMNDESISRDVLLDEFIELPRFNYGSYGGEDYNYVYGVGQTSDSFLGKLIKVNVNDGSTRTWSEDDVYPGEPVFLESPDATAEDDGVILSVIIDAEQEHSFLLVLDASTFEEIGRAVVPHVIPLGFHGQFFEL
ncbi:MAG: carotenoid oxygenase family protein [bacterium]